MPVFVDPCKVIYYSASYPNELYLKAWFRAVYGKKKMPPMVGLCIFGMIFICFNDPALLEDVYVKQNKFYSKHAMM